MLQLMDLKWVDALAWIDCPYVGTAQRARNSIVQSTALHM
jgi:hypothetical protein